MDIRKYLKKIKYTGSINPDLDTLKALHKSHLYNIPFENLDIHSNRKILLDHIYLSDKMLNSSRGGYCYELNGMFYILLKELGFKVKMISARVYNDNQWSKEFDHLVIIVELDKLWLADVGFGDCFIEPIKIQPDIIQKDLNGFYKIGKHDEEYLKLMKSVDGVEFTNEYIFTLNERTWNEFENMNCYHQTSPLSHFTQKKVCSIATEDGRITLSNDKLTITQDGNKQITEIKDEKEFDEMLFKYFGMKLGLKLKVKS